MCVSSEPVARLRLGHVLTPKSLEMLLNFSAQNTIWFFSHPTSWPFWAIDKSPVSLSQRFFVLLQPYLSWRTAAEILQLADQCFKVSQKWFGVTLICLAANYRHSATATYAAEPSLHWGWKTACHGVERTAGSRNCHYVGITTCESAASVLLFLTYCSYKYIVWSDGVSHLHFQQYVICIIVTVKSR